MLCETISYRWQFCIWQFSMVILLLKILCCLLSGECSLKFMSFVIESPSWFEPSLTLQVLFPVCNLRLLLCWIPEAYLVVLCSQLCCVWDVPSDPFYWSKCSLSFRAPVILFILLYLARAKSMLGYVLGGKYCVHLV